MVKKLKKKVQRKSVARKVDNPVADSAREIWLAGLGAFSVAQQEGEKILDESNRFFDKLVKEGSKIEKKTRKEVEGAFEEIRGDLESRVKDFRGEKDVEKPVGEWNRLEFIADGGKITVLLNGIVVNRTVDCNPQQGRIQIQSEGAEIFFRKFDLTPLDQSNITVNDSGRQKRFIYNSDGGNMFIDKKPPMTPARSTLARRVRWAMFGRRLTLS